MVVAIPGHYYFGVNRLEQNRVHNGQTPQKAASDQDVHYLPIMHEF